MRGAVLVAVLAAGGAAWAQVPSRLDEIFSRSSFITTTRVKRVQGALVELEDRSLDFTLPSTYAPPEGSRLVRVCTFGTCPEWVAIDRGGFYAVRSIDPGAEIFPGIVSEEALDLVTRGGTPMSSLCLRARILWLGLPAQPGRFEGTFDPGSGDGIVWGQPFARPRRARLALGPGAGPWPDEAVSITLLGPQGVRFTGGPVERAIDGCYKVDVMPVAPLARTPAELAAALRGLASTTTIARGSITLAGKTGPLELLVRPDGGLVVRSPLASADARVVYDEATYSIRLPASTIVLDLDGLVPPIPGAGVAAAIVDRVRVYRELRGEVYGVTDATSGTFTLR